MAAKKRNNGVLQIFRLETIKNEHGEDVEVYVPQPQLDQPKDLTQVAHMERWVNQAVRQPDSGLEDGEYLMIRVMKSFKVGTTRAATFSDLYDETEEQTPEQIEPEKEDPPALAETPDTPTIDPLDGAGQ